jgi:tRNA(fMet)-specific endonuclease VapC
MMQAIEEGCEQIDPDEGDFLLDTNTVIRLMQGEPEIRERVAAASATCLSICCGSRVVLRSGEVDSAGSQPGTRRTLRDANALIDCDLAVAREYGRVNQVLRARGRPIPQNDVWIAATACAYRLVLASADRHFHAIDGLVVDWW